MAEPAVAAGASEDWRLVLPDLADDLEHGRIGLDQLLEARAGRNGTGRAPNQRLKDAYAAAYPEVLKGFEAGNGHLRRIEYGPYERTAVALTERFVPERDDPWWKRLLGLERYPEYEVNFRFPHAATAAVLDVQNQCEFFRVQRYRVRRSRYMKPFSERLFDAGQRVLELDEKRPTELPDQLTAAHRVLNDVQARYHWIQNRAASVNYLRGIGFGLVGVFVALLIWLAIGALVHASPVVVLCMAGGALAAAANSTLRLVQGTPTVRGEDSRTLITLFAAMRPALGAVFALIAYALIVGTVVPAKVPSDSATLFWFVIGVSFIAGFSEAFTPDLIQGASRQFAGAGSLGGGGSSAAPER